MIQIDSPLQVALGEGAEEKHRVKVGDMVVSEQIVPCHVCPYCKDGKDFTHPNLTTITLPQRELSQVRRTHGIWPGYEWGHGGVHEVSFYRVRA